MKLIEAAGSSLNQLSELLSELNDEAYCRSLPVLNNASIGQHVRHILNFYSCAINGNNTGEANYDARERDKRVEECSLVARLLADDLLQKIQSIDLYKEITVIQNYSMDKKSPAEKVMSTVGRELMYALDHTIHHLAIIKIGIKTHFPELQLEENLGVAPSTMRNRN